MQLHHVYVIRSVSTGALYFGRTDDLEKRLGEHNRGGNTSTREGKPWEYVYVESYRAKKDATAREAHLKQYGNARTYVKRRLSHSLS